MGGVPVARLGLAATLIMALHGAVAQAAVSGVGSWRPTGSLLATHYGASGSVLADGRVLVLAENGNGETTMEIYDPAGGTWSRAAGPPGRAWEGWTVVPLAEGGALAIGQTECTRPERLTCLPAPTTSSYRLVPGGSTWTPAAAMNVARGAPATVVLGDGRVLVAGGFGDTCAETELAGFSCSPVASAEIYDPATNQWSVTTPMPTPRGGVSATLMSNGTVLLVGGSASNDALRYNPASARWTTLRPSAFGHTGSRLVALPGDRAIALGGESGVGFYGSIGTAATRARVICASTPEIYTAATNTWIEVPPLPDGSFACSTNAAPVSGGQILYASERRFYLLDSRQRCWSTAAAPQYPGLLAPLPGGGALDFAGTGPDLQPLTAAEIYTPGASTCVASARMQKAISSQLTPRGAAFSIQAVLKHGYTSKFALPFAGRLTVDWDLGWPPDGGEHDPTVIGMGQASSTRQGTVKLRIALSAEGVSTLREELHPIGLALGLRITVRGTFVPMHGKAVTAVRNVTLTAAGVS